MLTTRGWSFLLVSLFLVALGSMAVHMLVKTLGVTLLLWFFAEWFVFLLRIRLATPGLRCRRVIRDERGATRTLWAGRSFQVVVEVRLHSWLRLPYARIADHLPFGVEVSGATEGETELATERPFGLRYQIRPHGAGRVRFEGVRLRLADLQGFFWHSAFVAAPQTYRVLPPLADVKGKRPTVKRYNLLPSPGLHRHLRPGSGSELLDLRDYLPGDPPKTIAWKVSARRDRLITKEFESEVPVRCTLFVDAAQSVRLGPMGRTALARLVDLSAAVAQANSGTRDLTGLCLFDDREVLVSVRPARGTRHLIDFLHHLADAAGLAPATGAARIRTLLPLAYSLAQEVYPELIHPRVNRLPAGYKWFWPPGQQIDGWGKRIFRGLVITSAFLPMLLTSAVIYWQSENVVPFVQPIINAPPWILGTLGGAALVSLAVLYFAFLRMTDRLSSQFFSSKRRRFTRWRAKPLAALLSVRYGLAPGGLGLLLKDDRRFSLLLQRFLAEHHVPFPIPYFDSQGRYLFASPDKVEVLAGALMRSVGRGRDNELFVLLVDLLELGEELKPLLKAVKVTLARHHQVMVICPWPPGIPLPRAEPVGEVLADQDANLQKLMRQGTIGRFHEAYARFAPPVRQNQRAGGLRGRRRPGAIGARSGKPIAGTRIGEKAMTQAQETNLSSREATQQLYTYLAFGALLCIMLVLLNRGLGGWSLLLVGLGVVGVTLRWRFGVILTVALLGLSLYFLDTLVPPDSRRSSGLRFFVGRIRVDSWVLGAAVLIYAASHYRVLGLSVSIMPRDPRPVLDKMACGSWSRPPYFAVCLRSYGTSGWLFTVNHSSCPIAMPA